MILIALTFLIIFLLIIIIYICNFIKTTIIKEIILYPASIFSTVVVMMLVIPKKIYVLNLFSCLIGSSLLGIIFHYFTMKKIDSTTSKIDIYIYTLLQVYTLLFILDGEEPYIIIFLSFYVIFYFVNIYCFYRFKRDKLFKIIIMPSLISVLTFFSFGLITMFLSAGSV